jgi:hypothetical protein
LTIAVNNIVSSAEYLLKAAPMLLHKVGFRLT